jgi:hypothetical protein
MLYLSDIFIIAEPRFLLIYLFDLMQRNAALKDTAFARADAPINRDNLYYLGITDGLYDYLVVAWSHVDGNNNRWLTAVHALHRLVGPDNLPLFRIAFDPGILSDFFIFRVVFLSSISIDLFYSFFQCIGVATSFAQIMKSQKESISLC